MSMNRQALIILTGPVGCGKSTSALAVAERLRAQGVCTACIDLDQIYCMARQGSGFGDESVWQAARRGAAALSDVLFATVADAVIVEGGFFDGDEVASVIDNVATDVRADVVTLHASFDRTLERVAADTDPGRVASRDPVFLRTLHKQFVAALPYLAANSTVVETDGEMPDAVADRVAELALRRLRSVDARGPRVERPPTDAKSA